MELPPGAPSPAPTFSAGEWGAGRAIWAVPQPSVTWLPGPGRASRGAESWELGPRPTLCARRTEDALWVLFYMNKHAEDPGGVLRKF